MPKARSKAAWPIGPTDPALRSVLSAPACLSIIAPLRRSFVDGKGVARPAQQLRVRAPCATGEMRSFSGAGEVIRRRVIEFRVASPRMTDDRPAQP